MQSLANNRCGACAQCCFFPAVPEFGKGNHFWCAFCDPGGGCKCYSLRPLSCSEYVCLWYVNEGMPINMRPDQCGVMFERLVDAPIFLAMVDPKRPNSWQLEPARQIIVKLIKDGYSIVVHAGVNQQKHVLLAEGQTTEGVMEGINHAIRLADNKIEEMEHDRATVRN